MDRGNHYESAFEEYLRDRRLGYIAVDETRRASLDEEPVKSLDFIVYGAGGARLLVDVKGRRFPMGTAAKPRRVWETWSTRDDVDGLVRWAHRFGPGYRGLLVFLYEIQEFVRLPDDTPDLWVWRGKQYLLRAVPVDDYRRHMRVRSPKWGTVALCRGDFQALVRPFWEFTHRDGADDDSPQRR